MAQTGWLRAALDGLPLKDMMLAHATSSWPACSGSGSASGISWFVVLFLFVIVFTPYFHEVLGGSHTTAYLVAVAVVLSFFVSVILHELGHALVARRNGLSVAGIDLWAFGGLTRMRELPQHARSRSSAWRSPVRR